MSREFDTDEDEMIFHLELHRDTIIWLSKKLDEQGIRHKITRGGTSQGDILLINEDDAHKVKDIIRKYHIEFNGQ